MTRSENWYSSAVDAVDSMVGLRESGLSCDILCSVIDIMVRGSGTWLLWLALKRLFYICKNNSIKEAMFGPLPLAVLDMWRPPLVQQHIKNKIWNT